MKKNKPEIFFKNEKTIENHEDKANEQMSDPEIKEKEARFLKELDQFSMSLRNAAADLANFLESLQNKTYTVKQLIAALKKLEAAEIEKIDIYIEGVGKIFLELNKDKSFQSDLKENMISFLEKQEALNREAVSLMKKAFELSEK